MLNSTRRRRQFLADVCIERILPERRPPRPRRAEEGENAETVEELPEARLGVLRVSLPPPVNGGLSRMRSVCDVGCT